MSMYVPHKTLVQITKLDTLGLSTLFMELKHKHTSFYCTLLCRTTQVLRFLQMEGKILYQRKHCISLYCNSLYCDTGFVVVVWNQTCIISEVCLHICDTLQSSDDLSLLPIFPTAPGHKASDQTNSFSQARV